MSIDRWSAPNGYRDVLRVGMPLVASMASATITMFTDRVFLGHYSLEALAASMTASTMNFQFIAFFSGLATYVNVFIAQYTGARQPYQVGPALWQGVWFSLLAAVCMVLLALPAEAIFAFGGHDPAVQVLEVEYYRILCYASGFNILTVTLGEFYTGRGLTRPVMVVNMIGAAVNIPLDYMLINGVGPFPELGIRGAGIATGVAWALTAVIFALMVFRRRNEEQYGVLSGWHWNPAKFKRLLVYGLPSGCEFFFDVFAFAFFILLVGRLGNVQLAATNMVLSVNHFSFMPMVGLHIAAQTLVGQAIGAGRPDDAAEATRSVLHLNVGWALVMMSIYLLFPDALSAMFRPTSFTPEQYAPVREAGRILLVIVAVYTLFDAVVFSYFGALKGAGDIRYTLKVMSLSSVFIMALGTYLILEVFHLGLYAAWGAMLAHIGTLMFFSWRRFRQGQWRSMSVIR